MTVNAQETDATIYYPGDGVYIVGVPGNTVPVLDEPTLVAEAYQATFNIKNVDVASIKAGDETYNVSDKIKEEGSVLDLHAFMGVGHAHSLTVRNVMSRSSYQFGQYNPNRKTDQKVNLIAAFPMWGGYETLPLGVYDHWDCPISYEKDPMLGQGKNDAVTVDFGNPHEGLVARYIDFSLVVGNGNDASKKFTVTLDVYNNERSAIIYSHTATVDLMTMARVSSEGENQIYCAEVKLPNNKVIIDSPFKISVSGFAQEGVNAWIPRAVDSRSLYPTHSVYSDGQTNPASDVCVNINGYFNYIGSWGWYDGKVERGECYSSGDLVQIYYDPKDADWPGDYYMGESAFPVECTFGSSDILIESAPDWISNIQYDVSQWDEYGSVQLILTGEGLPEGVSGRKDPVVFTTADGASKFTIFVRQGTAVFDGTESGIEGVRTIDIPEQGGMFDLNGRRLSLPPTHYIYIKDGKKYIGKK